MVMNCSGAEIGYFWNPDCQAPRSPALVFAVWSYEAHVTRRCGGPLARPEWMGRGNAFMGPSHYFPACFCAKEAKHTSFDVPSTVSYIFLRVVWEIKYVTVITCGHKAPLTIWPFREKACQPLAEKVKPQPSSKCIMLLTP